MRSSNISYIPAVDHLRGFAALLILLYHGFTIIGYQLRYDGPFRFDHWIRVDNPFAALLVEGHTAVSLFMVLSGFIFTIGSFKSTINYAQFLRNRFLRTYPLFLLLLGIGIFANTGKFTFIALLQTLFFMGNLPGSIDAGTFSSMFWAIAVEWQFYLVFPFILFFVNRHGVKYLLGLAAVFIIMRGLAALEGASLRDLGYWTIVGRMDQFLAGIGAGWIYRRYFRPGLQFDLLFVISSVLTLMLLYVFNRLGGWPAENQLKLIWPTVEGLCWAGVILGYLSIARVLPTRLSAVLVALGTVSYSMYLVHFVVIDAVVSHHLPKTLSETMPDIGPGTNALLITLLFVLPIVLAISTLTYHIIEKPFLQLRHVYVDRTATADDNKLS